ncbi:MAG TPA: NAD(P)-binding domain-containing protein [Jatrophihabitantaceae bacterium]|nr:NAD(P)-binding domain-containing protein [Jatrophihabitantaceae bacterium]
MAAPSVHTSKTSRQEPIRRDVVVVGAGQAGLAIGYFLGKQGRDFTILEAASEPAQVWRQRWDSLQLFTSARYSALPGMPFPGDPDHYPSRDEVVAYLSEYAHHFALPVELGSQVRSVRRPNAAGTFLVELADRTYEANHVVIATGPFQVPRIPDIASGLDPDLVQLHSSAYRSPKDVPSGTVLVVGGGNTGFQIADELSATHHVHLAVGSSQTPLPQRLLGRDLFWYLDKTGLIRTTNESRIGQRLQQRDTLIGSRRRTLQQRGVEFHPRAVDVTGRIVTFADQDKVSPDAVIWATGFGVDHSWIDVPVFDDDGRVIQRRGVTASPGLYFLGLLWLHTRGSALIGWVKDDAEYVAQQISGPKPTRQQEDTMTNTDAATNTMRAIVQDTYGSVDALHLAEVARPQIAEDEVLVEVRAAGLDRGTWHIMAGQPYLLRLLGFGFRRPKNRVPGFDVAGTVVEVGSSVAKFSAGDEVFGISRGSFAEYAAAHEDKLARKPANLTFDQAAVVPISAGTALQALTDAGRVEQGQRVLIIGASGGVGSYAVQLAKAFGAEVTGVCSTAKLELVRSLGADHVIDYSRQDFADGTNRYDLILDMGGNSRLSRLRKALNPTGTLVIVGGEEGGKWTGGFGRSLRAPLLSPFVRQRLTMLASKERASDQERLTPLIEAGTVTPSIDRTYPLDRVAEAMRHLEAGDVRGKVVITI